MDSIGMSTNLGLFYAERLGNCIHDLFMFTFLQSCFFRVFRTQLYDIKYSYPIEKNRTQLYDFKYSYLILVIICLKVIISI